MVGDLCDVQALSQAHRLLELIMAAIVLENVSAHFPIYGGRRSLRKAIFQRATGGSIEREGKNNERIRVKALNDISLTLNDGDRVGLIGHNGAGKSTLLKLMAGIYEPVSGSIKVEGRVTPLFDAMPGLDGEDTGYENIITSGLLIGMSRQQIEAKIPEIEEFCELGEYLTLPVRTYSTGMTMRLGFALVTALDPGVLLMDEGFGTGDQRFAERAEARMKDFVGRSRILVLASHSDRTIRSMCNKAVLMEAGRIVALGPVNEICDRYYESVHTVTVAAERNRRQDKARNGFSASGQTENDQVDAEGHIEHVALADRLKRTSGAVRVTRVTVKDAQGKARWDYVAGETATFRFEYRVLERVDNAAILFRLNLVPPGGGELVFTEARDVLSPGPIEAGYEGALELSLKVPDLVPNQYMPYIWLGRTSNSGAYDVVDANVGLPAFVVKPSSEVDLRRGLVSLAFEIKKSGAVAEAVATKAKSLTEV
jgi:ABC-type polysaccharide/polyol phosphate transport system ATPase subunit